MFSVQNRLARLLVVFLSVVQLWAQDGGRRHDTSSEIRETSYREVPFLGCDTRLRLAKLTLQNGALLKVAALQELMWLRTGQNSGCVGFGTYRVVQTLLPTDPETAESLAASLHQIDPLYGRLALSEVVDYWTRHNPARALRLAEFALRAGVVEMQGLSDLLVILRHVNPEGMKRLYSSFVSVVESSTPSATEVLTLISSTRAMIGTDRNAVVKGASTAVNAVSKWRGEDRTIRENISSRFVVRGTEVRTSTSEETLLFQAACFLQVFAPEELAQRRALFSKWQWLPLLADLTESGLASAVTPRTTTRTVLSRAGERTTRRIMLSEMLRTMPYPQALVVTRSEMDPLVRARCFLTLMSRESLSDADRSSLSSEALRCLRNSGDAAGRAHEYLPFVSWALLDQAANAEAVVQEGIATLRSLCPTGKGSSAAALECVNLYQDYSMEIFRCGREQPLMHINDPSIRARLDLAGMR
jgi:hypothetical protein